MKRIVYLLFFATLALGAAHSQSAAQKALYDRYVTGTGFAGNAGEQDVGAYDAASGVPAGPVAKSTNQFVDYLIKSASGKDFALEDYVFLAYTEFLGGDGLPVAVSTVSGTLKAGEAGELGKLVRGGALKLNDVFRVVHERDSLNVAKEGPAQAPDAKSYETARYLHVYAFVFRDSSGRRNVVRIIDEHTVGSAGRKF